MPTQDTETATPTGAPRLPTLAYALLALLAGEPMSGYVLATRLRDPIGQFWEARHSQIYPQLSDLEGRGLLTGSDSAGPGPRPRRTHEITPAGVEALRAWVGEPVRRWAGRDELLLKVYASWIAEPRATLGLLRDAEAHHAAQLATYLARRNRAREAGVDLLPGTDQRFTDYATLRRGIGHERGRLAWCRWLIMRIQSDARSGAESVGAGT